MDEWRTRPQVIDETVRVAKRFLEEHPDEARKYGQLKKSRSTDLNIIGYHILSRFLHWESSKIRHSLERLGMIKREELDEEISKSLPTDGSARTFVKKVKQYKLPKEKQKAVINRMIEEDSYGEKAVDEFVIMEKYKKPEEKKKLVDERIKQFDDVIAEARNLGDEFADKLIDVTRLTKELGIETFNNSTHGILLIMSFNRIEKYINEVKQLKSNKNEKTEHITENFKGLGN
ncbi:hypothetical protein GF312_00565 [Candidatus Poribacteria bacterium]|nr:hypothetical protein [Candidatus Poribacteria bacterium]